MSFYLCKRPGLYGVPVGAVERYAEHRAAPLLADGFIEPFDESSDAHLKAPGANAAVAFARAEEAEKRAPRKAPRKA